MYKVSEDIHSEHWNHQSKVTPVNSRRDSLHRGFFEEAQGENDAGDGEEDVDVVDSFFGEEEWREKEPRAEADIVEEIEVE